MRKEIKEKKKSGILSRFFLSLGIIFLIIIILSGILILYLSISKPFGLKITNLPTIIFNSDNQTESTYDHPLLTDEQEILLESIGIDTTKIPTSLSEEQINCAVRKLGQKRVDEIMAGSSLQTFDYIKAESCF